MKRKQAVVRLLAIVVMLAGLAVSIAFRMLFWNIGAEGQLAMGALVTAWIPLFVLKDSSLPPGVLLIVMGVAAFGAGAIWGLIPAALKAVRQDPALGSSILLTGLAGLLAGVACRSAIAADESKADAVSFAGIELTLTVDASGVAAAAASPKARIPIRIQKRFTVPITDIIKIPPENG